MATRISWCDEVWNPTTGCSRVSEGCRHCYAEALSLRFGWSKKSWTAANATENLMLHEDRLDKPLSWKSPRHVFVNSMSDLFHEQIPDHFIDSVFAVMALTPQHTYQVLTKRANRMRDYTCGADRENIAWNANRMAERCHYGERVKWPLPNVWLGVSVEDQKNADERIPFLVQTPAAVRFLSCEPLLGPIDIHRHLWRALDISEIPGWALNDGCAEGVARRCPGIAWVITGGESGSHISKSPERWMQHEWARAIKDECVAAEVPYFFKQSSGVRTEMGTALEEADGSRWEWRQFPGEMTPPVRVG